LAPSSARQRIAKRTADQVLDAAEDVSVGIAA
jgi:hypothetical protein